MKNRLLNLLASNRALVPDRPAAPVLNAARDEATVYLYGPILSSASEAEYFGGVAAESFVPMLTAVEAKTIHLRIDSPGGTVFGAQAISQALREHPANIIAHVDGLAASAATSIATAADEIVMGEGAMYMVHRAWTLAYGNVNDMLEVAELLEKMDGVLAEQYAARTGASAEEMLALMDAETWMTAQEAVDAKFVNRIAIPAKKEAKASAKWDLSAYAKAPAAAPEPTPEPVAEEQFASVLKREWQIRQLRMPRP
jgi:ATP-dependent Clp protease protease subunit